MTSNIAALAQVCHARRVPLIVDAAWGGAFGFCSRLPANPLVQGADAMVASLHKTMGALGQGSILLARGGLVEFEDPLLGAREPRLRGVLRRSVDARARHV